MVPTTYIPKYLGDIHNYLNGGSNFKTTATAHDSQQDNDVQMIDEEKKQSEIDRYQ